MTPSSDLRDILKSAIDHHRAGRPAEAEPLCAAVLEKEPSNIDALRLLGLLCHESGRSERAAHLLDRALALKPDSPANWHMLLGIALRDCSRGEEALFCLDRAIAIDPTLADAHGNRGNVLMDLGRRDEAIAAFTEMTRLLPDEPVGYRHLAIALDGVGKSQEAFAALYRALELAPESAELHRTLGDLHAGAGDSAGAIAAYRAALVLDPADVDAVFELANLLDDRGSADEARALRRAAMQRHSAVPRAHLQLAYALLRAGDFRLGWREYEWRWRSRTFRSERREFSQPLWMGQDLAGKTILLHDEQGFGDAIQMARYAPLLPRWGARVIVLARPPLVRVLRSIRALSGIYTAGDTLPAFDYHCPMMSLPRATRTLPETIPVDIPYLAADPQIVRQYRDFFAAEPPAYRVGIQWAGNPSHRNDRHRSCRLADFGPLAEVPGVAFYSFQNGPPAKQIERTPRGMLLGDVGSAIADFADTAALLAYMDLVITVDTALVHLAGALAKPVWVLLSQRSDFRWMRGREDSPWYPTARLFRQTTLDDWGEVMRRVIVVLRERMRRGQ